MADRLDSFSREQQEQFRQRMRSRCSMGWGQQAATAREQAQPA